ncbi:MAG: AAA-like domain-containing protein [Myxococcota bacterium]
MSRMERFFNTAGPLNTAKHYALDPLARWDLPKVLSLIEQEKYFLLHAPRQTGKTTCLQALATYLNKQGHVRCLYVSLQQAQAARQDFEKGIAIVLGQIASAAHRQLQDDFVAKNWQNISNTTGGAANAMLHTLTQWCDHSPKPIVLLMDEIDALVGNTLIAVLHQLRTGYCDRPMMSPFPQSIVLCGMRHLRDYRMQLGEESGQVLSEASPFNINSDSLRLGDFSQEDIQNLYSQHTDETGQPFEQGVFERVFELTQGQPWLVNALAYGVCFRDKAGQDRSKTVTVADIETAKEELIQRRETHLDQLMAKLKQQRVHRVIASIVSRQNLHPTVEDFEYVMDLGLICKDQKGVLGIANPIYREVVPRALASVWEKWLEMERCVDAPVGQPLDMNELLSAFQRFFREHSESWLDQFQYKEAGPQLLLQAFLQRTVNSTGSIQREQAVGSGRTDLVVTWPLGDNDVTLQRAQHKQVVVLELKLIHQKDSLQTKLSQGLQQTAAYMQRFGTSEGHLLLFDRRAGKSWDERIWVKQAQSPDGKAITAWGL